MVVAIVAMKPVLFIGTSSDHLDVAHAVQESLERVAECTVWAKEGCLAVPAGQAGIP